MQPNRDNIIVEKTFQFAISIIEYSDKLFELKKFVLSNQILKAGTSIGANVREAQNAESKQDFIHKMKIAAKEADECDYWLALCKSAEGFPDPMYLITSLNEIIKIISRIISTSKRSVINMYIHFTKYTFSNYLIS